VRYFRSLELKWLQLSIVLLEHVVIPVLPYILSVTERTPAA
jgi:hypothetical protein